jgi:hypothetical protein
LSLKSGVVVAGVGLWRPTVLFAEIIDACAKNLDDAAALALLAWQKVRALSHPDDRRKRCSVALAGYSEKNQRVMMHVVHEHDGGAAEVEFWPDTPGYITAPGNTPEIVKTFTARFSANFDSFDAGRDGVELFETLRRHSKRDSEVGPYHSVGGYLQYTTITREGISSRILKHWPDRTGHRIDPDAPDDPQAKDDNWPSMTMGELRIMRDSLVAGQSRTFLQDAEAA